MRKVSTNKVPAAIGPYVQGNIVNNLLFSSGQIPLHPETGLVVGETITDQTKQVMTNIQGLLESQNLGFDQVVKTTCFLKNMNDFQVFNEVYATYFVGEKVPARSTVEVARLPKDVLVEIEIIATLGE